MFKVYGLKLVVYEVTLQFFVTMMSCHLQVSQLDETNIYPSSYLVDGTTYI